MKNLTPPVPPCIPSDAGTYFVGTCFAMIALVFASAASFKDLNGFWVGMIILATTMVSLAIWIYEKPKREKYPSELEHYIEQRDQFLASANAYFEGSLKENTIVNYKSKYRDNELVVVVTQNDRQKRTYRYPLPE